MIRSRPSELVLTLDDLEQASRRLLARKRAAAGQPTNRPDRSTLYDRAFGALDPTACLHRGPQRSRDEAISHVRGRIGDHKQQSAEYCSTDEDETGHAAFNRGQIPLVWPSFNTPTAYEEDDTQPSDTGFTHILDAYADSSPESNATQTPSSKMLNIFATTVGTGSTVNAKPRGRDDTSETGDTNTNMDYAVTPRQRRPITQDVPSPPKSEPTKPKRLSNHIWAAIKSRTMAHFSSTPDAQSDPPSSLPAMPANDDCQLITFPYEVWSSSSSQTAEDKRGTELPGTIMPSVPVLRPTHSMYVSRPASYTANSPRSTRNPPRRTVDVGKRSYAYSSSQLAGIVSSRSRYAPSDHHLDTRCMS